MDSPESPLFYWDWRPAHVAAGWSPLLLAAQAAKAAGRCFAATLWARGVRVTLGALWLWGCWSCGKQPRPFPEPPADTLGFSRRVALPTSEQAVRRLPVGCVASAGHTSALISRSPSKYLTGDEVQVPWDSWARGRPLPMLRTRTLFLQCLTCHIITRSFSCTLAPRMEVSSVSPLSPDTRLHTRGRPSEAQAGLCGWSCSACRGCG